MKALQSIEVNHVLRAPFLNITVNAAVVPTFVILRWLIILLNIIKISNIINPTDWIYRHKQLSSQNWKKRYSTSPPNRYIACYTILVLVCNENQTFAYPLGSAIFISTKFLFMDSGSFILINDTSRKPTAFTRFWKFHRQKWQVHQKERDFMQFLMNMSQVNNHCLRQCLHPHALFSEWKLFKRMHVIFLKSGESLSSL